MPKKGHIKRIFISVPWIQMKTTLSAYQLANLLMTASYNNPLSSIIHRVIYKPDTKQQLSLIPIKLRNVISYYNRENIYIYLLVLNQYYSEPN